MNPFFKWMANNNKKTIHGLKKEKHFNQLKTIWEASARTSIPDVPDPNEEWQRLQIAITKAELQSKKIYARPRLGNLFQLRYAYAVTIIVLLTLSSLFIYHRYFPISYQTDRKEKLAFTLPDGSAIQLNCVSKLTFYKDFSKKSRQVTLKGEAYFDVKKGDLPFVIKTDVVQIGVLETSFNVKTRDEQIEVAVNRGTVGVLTEFEGKDSTIALKEGHLITCRKGSFPSQPQQIQFDQYPGWIHGNLSFHQTALKLVCQEIERQFDVKIQLADQQLGDISISGLFAADDLNNLLSVICILIQKEFRYDDKTIVIY
jgi:transmembrane sensor